MKYLYVTLCTLFISVGISLANVRTVEDAALLAAQQLNQSSNVSIRRAPAAADKMQLYRTFYKHTIDLEINDGSREPISAIRGKRERLSAGLAGKKSSKTVHIEHGDNEPALYIFNGVNGGFAVVSADTRAVDMLCYSDTGRLDDQTLNPALQWWLNRFVEEISSLTDKDEPQAGSPNRAPADRKATVISPLLGGIAYGQSQPFNNLCPIVSGQRCKTGCVATAATQIMRYWRYPSHGNSRKTYLWSSQYLSADFASATYDYNNMPESYRGSYNSIQANAVATLMHHAGVAASMGYGVNSSGAYDDDMLQAMIDYFGYDCDAWYWMGNGYTVDQISASINQDLEAGRPVFMGGDDANGNGGHAFVCHGRDAQGRFYFNWGWSGSGDCYSTLTSVHPNTSDNYYFSSGLDISVGLRPATDCVSWSRIEISATPDELPLTFAGVTMNEAGEYETPVTVRANSCDTAAIVKLSIVSDGSSTYGYCGDNLTWELSSDKTVLTIEGYGDMWDFTLTDMTNNTIPWKSAYTTIEQVILPDGITSIGDYAFFNHRQLTTISLPSSLTRIGMYAFARNAFSSIAIPDAVTYIDDYAFAYATNISSIDLPKNLSYLGTDVFINCSALKTVNYNAVNCQLPDNYDTSNPFYSVRSQITSFNIGNEVQVLPAGLCYKMTNISSVTLPLSLTTLNGNAFYGCSKLTAIAIPKNMNYIGKDVFAACSKLTSVIWNAKTCELAGTSTTNTPFRSICEQITSFTIGDDVEALPIGCCFGMTKLTSATIPAQLKAIGVYCFHTCSSLKTVRFNSPTPPSATTSSFNGIPADAVAQVPCGAKPAYVASTLPFSTYTTFGDFIYTVTLAVQTPETGSVNWLFIPDCDDNSGVIEATPALHYHFVRWEDEAENVATVGPERTIVVTKDITYTAVFEADHVYVISLYTDGHGSAGVDKRSYYAGETATLTATPDEGYDFLRWSDGNEDNPRTLTVTENLTLTAEFVKNFYIVTFVNYDGSELQTSEVGVGETPTYNGNEPSKPADDEYTYTFAGWADGENVYPLGTNLPEVTEDATYTAVYDDEQNEYTVIFQDEDGTVLESNYWYYGETPMYFGSEPSKEDNAEYSYYFAGWDKDIVAVTGDATYTAVYSSERNQYTITFQDEDGTELQSGLWYYGETPVYNGAEPSQYSDDEYTYYFAGWDKNIVAVTEDATYTAIYTATEALPKDIVLQERENDEYYTQFAEDYDGVTVNTVTLNRQFSQGKWSTLCLPFNVNKAMFGTLNFGSRIYEFRYAAGDGDAGVSLFFSIAKSIEAGKGYIVNADAKLAARTSFVFPGVKIDLSADKGEELNSVAAYDNLEGSSAQGNIELVGTLRKGTLKGSSGDNRYMGLKDNKIYYPNTSSGSTIYAYRGIFRSQTGTLNAERIRIIVDGEDMGELRIDKGEMLMNNSSEPHKFIENGILYIERDGVIYNAQGQRVE